MGDLPQQAGVLAREQEWAGLISKAAQGDQDAFGSLYDKTSPVVYGLALRIMGNPTDAEEVTLDVFTQVWGQARNYDPSRGKAGSWLLTLTRSRAIDHLRADPAKRHRQEPLDVAATMPSQSESPEQLSAEEERRRIVQKALLALASEQREAIELAYFAGLSQSEIAAKLCQPLGTIKTRIRLGMIKLRESLCPHEEGLTP